MSQEALPHEGPTTETLLSQLRSKREHPHAPQEIIAHVRDQHARELGETALRPRYFQAYNIDPLYRQRCEEIDRATRAAMGLHF